MPELCALCFVAGGCVVVSLCVGCVWFLPLLGVGKRRLAKKNHVSVRRNVHTKYQNRRLMRSMRDGGARKHLFVY